MGRSEREREDEIIKQAQAIIRRRGGLARAKKLTKAQRSEIARKGGLAKARKAKETK